MFLIFVIEKDDLTGTESIMDPETLFTALLELYGFSSQQVQGIQG